MSSFNPFLNAFTAAQYLLMLAPQELKQQAIKAAGVIKRELDENVKIKSQFLVIRDQNEILQQQLQSLKVELQALQFDVPKEKGRKKNAE